MTNTEPPIPVTHDELRAAFEKWWRGVPVELGYNTPLGNACWDAWQACWKLLRTSPDSLAVDDSIRMMNDAALPDKTSEIRDNAGESSIRNGEESNGDSRAATPSPAPAHQPDELLEVDYREALRRIANGEEDPMDIAHMALQHGTPPKREFSGCDPDETFHDAARGIILRMLPEGEGGLSRREAITLGHAVANEVAEWLNSYYPISAKIEAEQP